MKRRSFASGLAAGLALSCLARGARAQSLDFNSALAYSLITGENGIRILINGAFYRERYVRGTATTPRTLASGTKSFSGLLAVAAQEDGILGIDELVAAVEPSWNDGSDRADVTIRHLLTNASGLDRIGSVGNQPSFEVALGVTSIRPPATEFDYNPTNYQVFGAVLEKRLAQRWNPGPNIPRTVLEYLQRRILGPLGIVRSSYTWNLVPGNSGDPDLAGGAVFPQVEWAKVGLLLQGLPPQIIDPAACYAPSAVEPGYGLSWWLDLPVGTGVENLEPPSAFGLPFTDLRYAAGTGGQRLYVLPSSGLVIARNGGGTGVNNSGGEFDDEIFLQKLFNVIP